MGSLTLGGSAAGNYTIANVTTNGSAVTITPATLSYVATPTNGLAGAPIPALSGSVTGFQGADTLASATSGTLAFATTATPASPTGTYPITGTGLNANFGNYTFVQAPANATAFTINGSEIVGGDVFSDHGVTALPGATISLILGGNSEGTVTSGAGGAYQFELPVGTISPSGAGLFVYIASGPVNGNSFYNQATGAITNLDIYGNIFRVLNAPASLHANRRRACRDARHDHQPEFPLQPERQRAQSRRQQFRADRARALHHRRDRQRRLVRGDGKLDLARRQRDDERRANLWRRRRRARSRRDARRDRTSPSPARSTVPARSRSTIPAR